MGKGLPPIRELGPAHVAHARRLAGRFGIPASDADDFAQEVLLQAHRSRGSPLDPRALLAGIAKHIAARWMKRSRARQAAEEEGEAIDHGVASVGEELEAAERRVLVGATLAELPEIFRVVFLRCELGEEAVSDVAADLGINPNTVHTRLRLARARFREALARQLAKLQAKPGDV